MAEKGSVLVIVLLVMLIVFGLYSSLVFIIFNENRLIYNNYHRIKAGLGAETALNIAINLLNKEEGPDINSIEKISGFTGEVQYEISEFIVEQNMYKITARGKSNGVKREIIKYISKIGESGD